MDDAVAFGKVFTTGLDDLAVLMLFVILGVVMLRYIKPLKKLFLPAGLIGGTVALILGPQVLGLIDIPKTWSGIATPMINVVLTTTLFGTTINKGKLKKYSSAIDLIALTYFAQMVVGTVVGILLSKVWPDLPYAWGLMAIFTYWGGHGAATTAGTVFESLGNDGMVSLGIIMATLGLIIAMVAGMVWVNIGERKGWSTYKDQGAAEQDAGGSLALPLEKRKIVGHDTMSSDVVNGLAFQLAIVLACMWLGKFIFTTLAKAPWAPFASVMAKIPALLYGIVGAIIVWAVMKKTGTDKYADVPTIKNIGGVALELCIAAATATLNLKLFADYLGPILIHMVCIIALMCVICFVILPKWLHHKDWFELALMAFGQGHGSTPSGLALARCVDPDSRSYAWEAFGVALGVFTPITSTLAAVLPIMAMGNQWAPVILGLIVSAVCIVFGELFLKKQSA